MEVLSTAKKEKSMLRHLIGERSIKDVAGVLARVKELTSSRIKEIMDAQLEDELGYSKYDYKNKQTDNTAATAVTKNDQQQSQGDVRATEIANIRRKS